MARRHGTRVVIRGPGVVGPLDRLADVGPAGAGPRSGRFRRPAKPSPPDAEALEARLEKWFVERERFDRRGHPDPKGKDETPASTA